MKVLDSPLAQVEAFQEAILEDGTRLTVPQATDLDLARLIAALNMVWGQITSPVQLADVARARDGGWSGRPGAGARAGAWSSSASVWRMRPTRRVGRL